MRTSIESKYGRIVGEDISGYATNVYVEGQEHRGRYAIVKSADKVTEDDLLKASEEIMNRVIVEE